MNLATDRLARVREARLFLRFLFGSSAGLAVDLGGFALLSTTAVQPGIANLISSFTSITVVYLLVTRYAFAAGTTMRTYVAFVAWYSTSILVFSLLIELAVTWTGAPALVCKACSVPISFCLNYSFSRWLFRHRAAGSSRPTIATRDVRLD